MSTTRHNRHDITAIRTLLAPLIERVRKQSRPLVVEFLTVRLGPHSKGDDTRDPAKMAELQQQDWYLRYAALEDLSFETITYCPFVWTLRASSAPTPRSVCGT